MTDPTPSLGLSSKEAPAPSRPALDAKISKWLREANSKNAIADRYRSTGLLEGALQYKIESMILRRCANELREILNHGN